MEKTLDNRIEVVLDYMEEANTYAPEVTTLNITRVHFTDIQELIKDMQDRIKELTEQGGCPF